MADSSTRPIRKLLQYTNPQPNGIPEFDMSPNVIRRLTHLWEIMLVADPNVCGALNSVYILLSFH